MNDGVSFYGDGHFIDQFHTFQLTFFWEENKIELHVFCIGSNLYSFHFGLKTEETGAQQIGFAFWKIQLETAFMIGDGIRFGIAGRLDAGDDVGEFQWISDGVFNSSSYRSEEHTSELQSRPHLV